MFRHLSGLLLLLILFSTAPARTMPVPPSPVAAGTTVIVARHAERATDDPKDPSLSPAGEARAQALAAALQGAQVSAVYATELKRTRATAEPVAKRFQLSVLVSPAARPAGELAQEILQKHAGETVVVVGHSNTVPDIVEALSGQRVGAIEDHVFDRLFVVVVPRSGAARLIQSRYGQPTP